MKDRFRVANPRTCEGIQQGSETEPILALQELQLKFDPIRGQEDGEQPVEVDVEFGEMADISEAMLIGKPTLESWGYAMDQDDQGNSIVELRKLGVTILGLRPREQVSESWG